MYYWRGGLSQSMSSTCTCTVCFQWVVCHMCRHHFIATQTQSSAKQRQICWRQCYSSWRSISTNIVYCVYLNVLDNLIWLCPAQFLSPLTTIVVIWRYISKIEFLKLNFITFIAQFPELCALSLGRGEEPPETKSDLEGGQEKKDTLTSLSSLELILSLAWILQGAGCGTESGFILAYCKVPHVKSHLNSQEGWKDGFERHVHAYLQWYY